MREGGETLKRVGTEKWGGETKILKRRGKLGQGVSVLKNGGWNPLTNYVNNKREKRKEKNKKSGIIG